MAMTSVMVTMMATAAMAATATCASPMTATVVTPTRAFPMTATTTSTRASPLPRPTATSLPLSLSLPSLHTLPCANGRQRTLQRHLAAVPLVVRTAVAGHRERLRRLHRSPAHEPRHRRRRRQRRRRSDRRRGHGRVGVALRVEERREVLRPRLHHHARRLRRLRLEIPCERVVRSPLRVLIVPEPQTAVASPHRRRRTLRDRSERTRHLDAFRLQVFHQRRSEGGIVRSEQRGGDAARGSHVGGATGAADAVDVDVDVVGSVEVDHCLTDACHRYLSPRPQRRVLAPPRRSR